MTRKWEEQWLQSERILTTGDGTWKTTTDIITARTASAVHGTGAGTTVHIGALITVLTGVHGVTVRGGITVTMTHGTMADTMIRGDTPDIGEDSMTHGTTEDTGEATGAGMTHGIITITTAAGMTITTTITAVLHLSEAAQAAIKTHTTVFVHGPNPTEHSHRVTAHQANRQVR